MTGGPANVSWAARTVEYAVRAGSLRGMAVCSALLLGVQAVSETSVPPLLSVGYHLGYSLAALVVLWRGWDTRAAFLGLYLLLVVDLLQSSDPNEPLVAVAVWIAYVTTATPALLLRGRQAVLFPFGSSATMAALVALGHPDWDHHVPVALLVGTWCVWPAGLVFRRALDALVASTEEQEAATAREHSRAAIARTAGRELAEDARVLHDTVINTLSALASGQTSTWDPEFVRQRCRHDLRTIRDLLAGRQSNPLGLRTAPADHRTPVRRTGLRAEELEQHTAALSPGVARALTRAVDELIRNADKHAEASEIVVDVQRRDDDLVITVSDDGRGFAAPPPPGRGLAESVVRRIESVGGWVDIRSRPGHGTDIAVTAPLVSTRTVDDGLYDSRREIARIRRAACWAWAVALTGAGVLMELANRPTRFTLAWASLGLVGAICATAWRASRRRSRLPGWAETLVILGVPAGYLLGFAGVGFGQDEPYLWFAIGLTPLMVILLVYRRTRLSLSAGVLAIALVGAVVTLRLWPEDRAAATIATAGVLAQLGQLVAWTVFHSTIGKVGDHLLAEENRAASSRRETAAQAAVATARQHWTAARVRSALELLASIANGDVDPRDPHFRDRCAEEEHYLRQLTQLSPELVYLSDPLARALAEARANSVQLTLRAGETDAGSSELADAFARLIIEAVAGTRPGSKITATLIPDRDRRLRLYLVGSRGLLDVERLRAALTTGWSLQHDNLGKQTLVSVRPNATGAPGFGDRQAEPAGLTTSPTFSARHSIDGVPQNSGS